MENSIDNEEKKVKLKEPKTFEEQLNILKDRNMIIEDYESAIEILKATNYYRITAYALQFKIKGQDKYVEGTSFNHMNDIYKFDERLRHLILGVLESIEISLRTYMAYHLSIKYGPEAHKNKDIFKDKRYYNGYMDNNGKKHRGLLDEMQSEINKNKKELFVKHHIRDYKGHFHIWAIVEIFSFGMLSKMYANLNSKDQKIIAKECFNINYKLLESWSNSLAYIRNICAHHGRLYNKKMSTTPKLHNKYKQYMLEGNKLYIYILAIKELIKNTSEWNIFRSELEKLIDNNIGIIDLNLIGFPSNWKEMLKSS